MIKSQSYWIRRKRKKKKKSLFSTWRYKPYMNLRYLYVTHRLSTTWNILLITRTRILHTYWLPHGFSNVMSVDLLSIFTFSLHFLKTSVMRAEMMENKAPLLSRYYKIRLIIVWVHYPQRTGNAQNSRIPCETHQKRCESNTFAVISTSIHKKVRKVWKKKLQQNTTFLRVIDILYNSIDILINVRDAPFIYVCPS